jgi:hypothetical protein
MAFLAASLLLGFLASTQALQPLFGRQQLPDLANGPMIDAKASVPLGLHARIEVYKNGGIAFAKENDPWTVNLAKMIKLLLFTTDSLDWPHVRPTVVQQPDSSTTVTITMDGLWYRRIYPGIHVPVIGIGSGTAAPSVNDISLQSTITLYDVLDASDVAFQDAGSFYWLNITGQFTGLDATVREVGLFIRVVGVEDIRPPDEQFLLLLARDLVSPPVTLEEEDVLLVKYAIRISKDVLVQSGLCDLVQFVFGLGDINLREAHPCPRTRKPSDTIQPAPILESGASSCYYWRSSPCVKAVFATQSIDYTDRFTVTEIPSGVAIDVRSPMTTITTNSTHLIIRTTLRVVTPTSTTFYGLALYRGVFYDAIFVTDVVTYTAFTTRVVTREMESAGIYSDEKYLLMFIPFDPPLAVPAGSRVQVTLELALPIS